MATFTDDFNRTDAVSDLGANWTDCLGLGLGISSNACYNALGDVSAANFVTGTTQTADQYAQVVIGNPGSNRYFSVLVRGSGADGTRSCYQITAGGTNELYISRVTSGSSTDIQTGTLTLNNGDVLRGEAEGTTLRLKINGVQQITQTDSNHTSGLTGLEIFRSNITTCTMENFEAGDIGGGGGAGRGRLVVGKLVGGILTGRMTA